MEKQEWKPIIPFVDESESFTLGFECGQIYNELEQSKLITDRLIHLKNKEQIRLICAHFGKFSTIEPYCKEWGYLTIEN